MANLFHQNPDLRFRVRNARWARILPHAVVGDGAPDVQEIREQNEMVLELVGEIAANEIAPHAAEVDVQGARLLDGEVHYADATKRQLKVLAESGLMGFILPEEFGGMSLPCTSYTAAVELVSAADASLMTIFALQSCGETLHRFGSRELQERYLPQLAAGEITACMALTEADAGSELGAVRTRAEPDGDDWLLTGGKIFITNGGARLLFVLARTEDAEGGAGLSLFAVERSDRVRVVRLEEKLGIHGSPTAQLELDGAVGTLVGGRGDGLYRCTMSLLHGVRLEVAAQAIGIAQAAQRQAVAYAGERRQFKRSIDRFAPVRDMLFRNALEIESARAIVFRTAEVVDRKRALARHGEEGPELDRCERLADLLTPLSKYYACEIVNDVTSRALQVHGGYGYVREYPAERYFRDARITNIYEGTSEIQVGSMVQPLLDGGFALLAEDLFDGVSEPQGCAGALDCFRAAADALEEALEQIGRADKLAQQGWARAFVDGLAILVAGLVSLEDAAGSERKAILAGVLAEEAMQTSLRVRDRVASGDRTPFDDATFAAVVDPYRDGA